MGNRLHVMSLKTQYENLGDLVINAILAAEVNRRGRFLGLSNGVPPTYVDDFCALAGRLSGRPIDCGEVRSLAPRLLAGAASGGLTLILSPGHNIQDRSKHGRQALAAATRFGLGRLRLLQVGASFEAAGAQTSMLYAQLLKAGHPLSVRDPVSQQLFCDRGVDSPIVPDLAFGLDCAAHNSGGLGLIAVRAREEQPYAELRDAIAATSDAMRAAKLEPALFFQVSLDAPIHARLASDLAIRQINADDARPSFDEAMDVYAKSGAIVSNRLHSLLVAASAGAFPVALLDPQERKIRGALAEAELSDLVTNAHRDSRDRVAELLGHRAEWHDRIVRPAFIACKQRLTEFFDGATR